MIDVAICLNMEVTWTPKEPSIKAYVYIQNVSYIKDTLKFRNKKYMHTSIHTTKNISNIKKKKKILKSRKKIA